LSWIGLPRLRDISHGAMIGPGQTLGIHASTLRSDVSNSQRPFALSYGEPWWWSSFGELLHRIKTGETRPSPRDELVEHLDKHPEAARTFNAKLTAMTGASGRIRLFGVKVLIDMGGGHGALASAILHHQPQVRAVIFDQPSMIDGTPAVLDGFGIRARTDHAPGDFFVSVPSGGDIYTLKDILHDWDDAHSIAILRNIRRAMSENARLLVVERVIPRGNEPFAGKHVDITMLVHTGGMERTLGGIPATAGGGRAETQSSGYDDYRCLVVEAIPL